MPAEPLLPTIPDSMVGPLGTAGELFLVLGLSWVLGRAVRSGLTRAGLQPPTSARPGLDWARIAGLVCGGVLLVWMLPSVVDASTATVLASAAGRLAASAHPLFGCLLALAVGDHQRRALLSQADSARGDAREALETRAEQIQLAAMVVAGLTLVGSGLWAAWPLGVALAVVWALRDPRVRPVLDRWASDLAAGRRLRKERELQEGAVLQLEEGEGVLAGPVGVVDTRVKFDTIVALMRNHVILEQLGEVRLPAAADPLPPTSDPPSAQV